MSFMGSPQTAAEIRGTSVSIINENISSYANRLRHLNILATQVVNGLIGFPDHSGLRDKETPAPARVDQSTQDHLRSLDAAIIELETTLNRLA